MAAQARLRLARAQRATGDYKQAAAAFRKCFALGERNLGREYASLASGANRLLGSDEAVAEALREIEAPA